MLYKDDKEVLFSHNDREDEEYEYHLGGEPIGDYGFEIVRKKDSRIVFRNWSEGCYDEKDFEPILKFFITNFKEDFERILKEVKDK